MDDKKKYIQLINFFLMKRDPKRGGVNFFNSPFSFTRHELSLKANLSIPHNELIKILKGFKGDKLISNYSFNKNTGKFTIKECTTDNLKAYKNRINEEGEYAETAPTFPYAVSGGTKWGNISMTFLNKEDVSITVVRKEYTTNFQEMGFANKRWKTPHPNELWTFLIVLSKLGGEMTITNPEKKDKYKEQKALLSKKLKSYFKLADDPFFAYRDGRSYKIRMILINGTDAAKMKTSEINKERLPIDKQYLPEIDIKINNTETDNVKENRYDDIWDDYAEKTAPIKSTKVKRTFPLGKK
jgi:hypothetical protein